MAGIGTAQCPQWLKLRQLESATGCNASVVPGVGEIQEESQRESSG